MKGLRGVLASIDNEAWPRIEAVLDAVLDLPAAERKAALDGICAGDAALRAQVDALLEADAKAGDFLEPSSPDDGSL